MARPIRIEAAGIGKTGQRRSKLGMVDQPEARLVAERLERLRRYPWSSYPSCAGWSNTELVADWSMQSNVRQKH